jgi:hypothetical protein
LIILGSKGAPIQCVRRADTIASDEEENIYNEDDFVNIDDTDKDEDIPLVIGGSFSTESSESTPAARAGDVLIQPWNDITSQTLPSTQGLSSDSMSVDNYTLLQGQILSEGVEVNHTSSLYVTAHLEIQI